MLVDMTKHGTFYNSDTSYPVKKVGLLGGSFDPVHLGHLALAEEAQKALGLHEVWLIPAGQSPYKTEKPRASAKDRLAMLNLAIQNHPSFRVIEQELDRPAPSYTIETLENLTSENPEVAWYWLMGLDAFLDFPNWKSAEGILELAHLVVGLRPGWKWQETDAVIHQLSRPGLEYRLSEEKKPMRTFRTDGPGRSITLLEIVPNPAASHKIRMSGSKDSDLKKELPAAVVQYIINHQLYA